MNNLNIREYDSVIQLNIQRGIKIRWMSQGREQMTDDLNPWMSFDDCCDNQIKFNFKKRRLINRRVTSLIVSFKFQNRKIYYGNYAIKKEQHHGRTVEQLRIGSVDNLERIFYFLVLYTELVNADLSIMELFGNALMYKKRV